MRRRITAADGSEIGCWCEISKRLVGPVVVKGVGEGFDEGLQFVEAVRQAADGVELVAPSTLVTFNGAIELQALECNCPKYLRKLMKAAYGRLFLCRPAQTAKSLIGQGWTNSAGMAVQL